MKLRILIIFIIGLASTTGLQSQSVNWISWTSLEQKMETSPKPVFIFVHTQWCGWCKKMQETTLKDPAISSLLNQNYYCVKLDAESKNPIKFNGNTYNFDASFAGRKNGAHELAVALLTRPIYPSSIFLDTKYRIAEIKNGSSNTENFKILIENNIEQ